MAGKQMLRQMLKKKTGAIFPISTIGPLAMIGTIPQKFVQQITVGSMHFHHVKTG